jgi:hypothetical protein
VLDEQVVREEPVRLARQGGRGDGVQHAGQQGGLGASVLEQLVRVVPEPVLFEQRAVAHILDTDAAPVEPGGDRPGLGQPAEAMGAPVGEPLERRAEVWRSQADDMPQPAAPFVPQFIGLVCSATRDQAAERVADQGDVGDLDRPAPDQFLERLGEFAGIRGYPQPGVEVEVDRRPAVVVAQLRAVRTGAVAPLLLSSERPAQIGLAQPVDEHREPTRHVAGLRRVGGEVRREMAERTTVQPHPHLGCDRRLLLGHPVAEEAADGAEDETRPR